MCVEHSVEILCRVGRTAREIDGEVQVRASPAFSRAAELITAPAATMFPVLTADMTARLDSCVE